RDLRMSRGLGDVYKRQTYNNLIQSVELAREMQNNNEPMIDAIDYKDTNVSTKVVKIIQSYKDIINRNTWRK
ncbi:hypothetical protein I5C00_07695, partial [Staphylococcus aureus]|nr:hypothetical protein [Staphylococcus aureus]